MYFLFQKQVTFYKDAKKEDVKLFLPVRVAPLSLYFFRRSPKMPLP